MADLVVFQEAQTEPENQNFCGYLVERCHGADLDSFIGDVAVGDTEKAL